MQQLPNQLYWLENFANSHIQSFHSGDNDDGCAILVLMCVGVLCVVVYDFLKPDFSNKFSLLCKSSIQALKINTDTYPHMCVCACAC